MHVQCDECDQVPDRLRQYASTCALDAKRRPDRTPSRDGWYNYYAGFTSAFALDVLGAAKLSPGATVLDPWNGSGTTTLAATQLGLRGVGVDINPVAVLVARAKLAHPADALHLWGLLNLIETRAATLPVDLRGEEPLLDWLHPLVARKYRSLEQAIAYVLVSPDSDTSNLQLTHEWPPLASFLLVCLLRAARLHARIQTSTNPTWIRPSRAMGAGDGDLASAFAGVVREFGEQLLRWKDEAGASTATRVLLGDSRALPLPQASVDFVLTSPPYCTRIDYVVNTSFELAALGFGSAAGDPFGKMRRTSMGTPLSRGSAMPSIPENWSPSIKSVLDGVKSHPSKASNSYYFKTFHQYFSDCAASLNEIGRCLKPRSCAVLVVQSSYYKEIKVDLPRLVVEMGETIGLRGEILSSRPVLKYLTQINRRSSAHCINRSYSESVVLLKSN